jgi:hypothetical protein
MPSAEPVPTSRAAFGCLIMVGTLAIPIAVAVITPGPWFVGVIVGTVAAVVAIAVGGRAVDKVLAAADPAPPGTAPKPGPDDPVHYVEFVDTADGCRAPGRHTPHHWFWRTDMPYTDGDGQERTAPMSGSRWCDGRGPR